MLTFCFMYSSQYYQYMSEDTDPPLPQLPFCLMLQQEMFYTFIKVLCSRQRTFLTSHTSANSSQLWKLGAAPNLFCTSSYCVYKKRLLFSSRLVQTAPAPQRHQAAVGIATLHILFLACLSVGGWEVLARLLDKRISWIALGGKAETI